MQPYAGVDYNPTLCQFQSQLQNMYHGHRATHARVDLNPMPETILSSDRD